LVEIIGVVDCDINLSFSFHKRGIHRIECEVTTRIKVADQRRAVHNLPRISGYGHITQNGRLSGKVRNLEGQGGRHAVEEHARITVKADFKLGQGVDQQGDSLVIDDSQPVFCVGNQRDF